MEWRRYLAFIKALLDRNDDLIVCTLCGKSECRWDLPLPPSHAQKYGTDFEANESEKRERERKRGKFCFLPNFHLFSSIPMVGRPRKADITKWVSKWVACDLGGESCARNDTEL